MFKIFGKTKTKQQVERLDRTATFLASVITRLQNKSAIWLSRQERKLTETQKKWFLIFFITGMSLVLGSIFYRGVSGGHYSDWLKQPPTAAPVIPPMTDSLQLKELIFKIDSLLKTERNKQDSIHH